jgi:hypothetical protein
VNRPGKPRVAPGERDPEDGVGFLRGGARPPTATLIAYVDAHRGRFGVEPICRVLTDAGVKIPEHLLGREDQAAFGAVAAR